MNGGRPAGARDLAGSLALDAIVRADVGVEIELAVVLVSSKVRLCC